MSSARQKVMRRLKLDGWSHVRTAASHLIFKHPGKQSTISVPMDGHATNPRVFTMILCQLKNGTKFERRDLGGSNKMEAQPQQQAAASKPSIPPALKQKILTDISHNATWKPFPGFPNYEISRDGLVQQAYRDLAGGGRTKLEHPVRVDVASIERSGKPRPVVYLSQGVDKPRTTVSLLKAVALAFLPQPPAAMSMPIAAPKDGNGMNAHVDNIEWISRTDLIIEGKRLEKEREVVTAPAGAGITDEQVLASATAFEGGATLEKAGKLMKCSSYIAKKRLIAFFGPKEFQDLLDVSPARRRKLAKAAAKAAKQAGKQIRISFRAPAPAIEEPKPVIYAKTPEAAKSFSLPMRNQAPAGPQFNVDDLIMVSFAATAGVAEVKLTLPVNSPTFALFLKWAPKK